MPPCRVLSLVVAWIWEEEVKRALCLDDAMAHLTKIADRPTDRAASTAAAAAAAAAASQSALVMSQAFRCVSQRRFDFVYFFLDISPLCDDFS
jgi:hypothetical protein